jgi:hypothetical protein
MRESTAEQAGPGEENVLRRRSAVRRLYLPTLVIAVLAGWLSWRGWLALAGAGITRSVNGGRLELAGPVVLGFVAAVTVIEQLWPAQRRQLAEPFVATRWESR